MEKDFSRFSGVNSGRVPFAEEMKERKYFNKRNIVCFLIGAVVTFVAVTKYFDVEFFKDNRTFGSCLGRNIGVIEITGDIDSTEDPDYYSVSAPEIIDQIEELENNANIKGILVNIESGGGTVVSTESVMLALKRSSKTKVAVIQNMGASGAYLIATGADRIFASRFSEVGSIGITNDFLDISRQDKKDGVILYDFSSGKYKGSGKKHSEMTAEQRSVIMENVMKYHDILVEYVSKNRKMPIKEVKAAATGRTYVGDDALELGLIDQIGGIQEAGKWLEYTIGDGEKASYCYAKR